MQKATLRLSAFLLLLVAAGIHVLAADKRPLTPPRFGHAIAVHEDLVLVSAPYANGGAGNVYLFRREGESHRLLKVVKRPRQFGESRFGAGLALDGKTLVVGDGGSSAGFSSGAGAAYLLDMSKLSEPEYKLQRITPPKPERLAGFGDSVSLHGDLVAVGESARYDGGSVTLFRRHADGWRRESTLNATQLDNDSMSVETFGESVAMSRTALVVSASGTVFNEVRKGAVFVYEKNDNDRFENAPTMLVWKDRREYDFFGHEVVIGDDVIVVSALLAAIGGHEDAGAVCLYDRGADGHFPTEPTTVLTADKPRKGEGFGSTLAISGRRILVGTSKPDDGEYSVYVFEPAANDDSQWTLVAHLEGTDEDAGFGGWGLAATDSLIYVGEPYSVPFGEHNGQVAVFARAEKDGKVTFRRIETIAMPE